MIIVGFMLCILFYTYLFGINVYILETMSIIGSL